MFAEAIFLKENLSIAKAMAYHHDVFVYIINTALPCCISSHRRVCIKNLRNDDMQGLTLLMIYIA